MQTLPPTKVGRKVKSSALSFALPDVSCPKLDNSKAKSKRFAEPDLTSKQAHPITSSAMLMQNLNEAAFRKEMGYFQCAKCSFNLQSRLRSHLTFKSHAQCTPSHELLPNEQKHPKQTENAQSCAEQGIHAVSHIRTIYQKSTQSPALSQRRGPAVQACKLPAY